MSVVNNEMAIDLNNLDKSNWNTYRFDEIAKNISERVDPNNTDLKVYIGLEHIDSESLHIKRHGTPDDVNGQKLKFYKGDIIFGRRRAYQRKAGIATWDGFCSAHALVLRANPNVIEPALFPFFLHSDLFMNRAIDISVGSLSPTINWGTLKHQEFLLPPKDIQYKLIEVFTSSNQYLNQQYKVMERLKILYLTCIEKDLIDHQAGKTKLLQIGSVIRGVGYKPENLLNEAGENTCTILRANNISDSKINFDDIKILDRSLIKDSQLLKNGDFAICMSNGSKELVGKAARIDNIEGSVSIGSFCSAFRPFEESSSKLLQHLFVSETYRHAIKRILSGSTINNLKPADIEGLTFKITEHELEEKLHRLELKIKAIKEAEISLINCKQLQRTITNKVF
jgi:restriction endonuclease S subunit